MNCIRTAATFATIVVGTLACLALPRSASADWPMFDHDSARSGFAAGDNTISIANVGRLHRRWVATFDTAADGAPILVSNVSMPRGSSLTLLFQTTLQGTTYAVNAYTGRIVWKHGTQGPNITHSMPAADPSGQWIYAPGIDAHMHKYAASSGKEFFGGGFPVRVTWSPDIEKFGGPINIANGFLYATTGGYLGDGGQYDGHVVAFNLATGQTHVINALCINMHQLIKTPGTCPDSDGGIWARGSAVVDPDPSMSGRVYAATGNGDFDANVGGHNYGDSVLAISADGSTLLDSFTPTDYDQLEAGDVDLGSTAPVMLPRQSSSSTPLMAVEAGKDAVLKLLNRQRLGGVGGELQDFNLPDAIFTAPAVWTDRYGRVWIFIGSGSAITAVRLVTDTHGKSSLKPAWSNPAGGTSPIVAHGIVYAATPGAVNAFNAYTGNMLWSSSQGSAGGTIGNVHWESPIVVKGWLYISDENGSLTAYSI